MGIPNVSEITNRAPMPSVPPVAPGPKAAAPGKPGAGAGPAAEAPAPKPPPPPPEPIKGFDMDINVGEHVATKTKVYNFDDPDTGQTVVQIPIENVLDLVANILRQLEAEGLR